MVDLDVFDCVDFEHDRGGVWYHAGVISECDDGCHWLEAHYRSRDRNLTVLDRARLDPQIAQACEVMLIAFMNAGLVDWQGKVYTCQTQDYGFRNLEVRLAPVPKDVYWTVQ